MAFPLSAGEITHGRHLLSKWRTFALESFLLDATVEDLDCVVKPSCNVTVCDYQPAEWYDYSKPWLTERGQNWVFPICYMIGFCMLILYYSFEKACCHWSTSWENLYFTVMLVLMVTVPAFMEYYTDSSFLFGHQDKSHGIERTEQDVSLASIYVLQALGLFVVCTALVARWIFESKTVGFYSAGSRALSLRQESVWKGVNPVAEEAARELQNLVDACITGSPLPTQEMSVCLVLALLFVIQTHISINDDFDSDSWFLASICLLKVIFIPGLIIYLVWSGVRLLIQERKISKCVDEIVYQALKEPSEEKGKEFFAYVLERANIGAVVRFSRKSLNQLVYKALGYSTYDTGCERWMWSFGCPDVDLTENPNLGEGLTSIHTSKTIAILIDAIQSQGRLSRRRQYLVKLLFMSVKGEDLSLVKTLLDGSGGYQNLYKLIYTDISYESQRESILEHMRVQAEHVRRGAKNKAYGLKIVSDIDDTLYASGGHFPNGCDKKYPKHTIYPGLLALYHGMDREARSERRRDAREVNVVYLTARPHIYKDFLQTGVFNEFKALVEDETTVQRMHDFPTLIPGKATSSLVGLLCGLCWGPFAWEPAGNAKYETFKKMQQLYEEYDFVWSGDNGQGDLLTGLKLIQDEEERSNEDNSRSRLRAVLIHEVLPEDQVPLTDVQGESLEEWKASRLELQAGKIPMIFYKTPVGAALQVVKHCLVERFSPFNLDWIMQASIEAFADIQIVTWDRWSKEEGYWMTIAQQDLLADLREARNYLVERNHPNITEVDQVGRPFDRLQRSFRRHHERVRLSWKDLICLPTHREELQDDTDSEYEYSEE